MTRTRILISVLTAHVEPSILAGLLLNCPEVILEQPQWHFIVSRTIKLQTGDMWLPVYLTEDWLKLSVICVCLRLSWLTVRLTDDAVAPSIHNHSQSAHVTLVLHSSNWFVPPANLDICALINPSLLNMADAASEWVPQYPSGHGAVHLSFFLLLLLLHISKLHFYWQWMSL